MLEVGVVSKCDKFPLRKTQTDNEFPQSITPLSMITKTWAASSVVERMLRIEALRVGLAFATAGRSVRARRYTVPRHYFYVICFC